MPSKPFTTQTSKAKSSLTSAILLLGPRSSHPGWPHLEGARDFPDPTDALQHSAPMAETRGTGYLRQGAGCVQQLPYEPSMSQGSPAHTMIHVPPLLHTDIIYSI